MFGLRSTSRHTSQRFPRRMANGERATRAALWSLGLALAFALLVQPALAQSEAQLSTNQIAVFLALGGGWEAAPTVSRR